MTSPMHGVSAGDGFQAASLGSLVPLEIEIAERLIAHFLNGFVFTSTALADSVYWSDLALAQPPLRLARMPASATPTQRFIKPAAAYRDMLALLEGLERGGDVPADIDLGGQYPAKLVARAQAPGQLPGAHSAAAQHERHRVMHRMSVLPGLVNSFVVFPANSGPAGRLADRELGGRERQPRRFRRGGAGNVPGEWLKVGALIAMQPEGATTGWLASSGAITGYRSTRHGSVSRRWPARPTHRKCASARLPAMARRRQRRCCCCAMAMPRRAARHPALRFVFAARVARICRQGGRYLLEPLALVEQTTDYELARYRQTVLGAA
jgi:hypothetical protein